MVGPGIFRLTVPSAGNFQVICRDSLVIVTPDSLLRRQAGHTLTPGPRHDEVTNQKPGTLCIDQSEARRQGK